MTEGERVNSLVWQPLNEEKASGTIYKRYLNSVKDASEDARLILWSA